MQRGSRGSGGETNRGDPLSAGRPLDTEGAGSRYRRRRTRQRRWQEVNAEWDTYLSSRAFSDRLVRLGEEDLSLLTQLVSKYGTAKTHVVVDVLADGIDVEIIRRLSRRHGRQSVHRAIDGLGRSQNEVPG